MLKFLLILFLIVWILSKLGGFFFRAGAASQNRQYQSRKPEGTMNTDGPPPKQKRNGNIKGGEYIDYEEVK